MRPHRLAGPGQRPFTPSTGVQIPLGTPTRDQGTCSDASAFFRFSPCDRPQGLFCLGISFFYKDICTKSRNRERSFTMESFDEFVSKISCPMEDTRQKNYLVLGGYLPDFQ